MTDVPVPPPPDPAPDSEPGTAPEPPPPPAPPPPAVPPLPSATLATTAPSMPVAAPEMVKAREPAAVVVLSIVTLGIYHLYWIYQVFRELKETTREGIGPIIGLVIALLISPVNWFVLPSEIGSMYDRAGEEKPVSGATGFWNLIPLIGTIIWIVKVQKALNAMWVRVGA
jgi:hypothetical protein